MRNQTTPPKNNRNLLTALIIVIVAAVIIILILVGIIIYFIFRGTTTPTPSSEISPTETASPSPTLSPKTIPGWQTYDNSRFGFSVQVPSDLDKEESINGDGATFTTHDPPMTIRVWGENNSLNLTAQQAIDFDKNDLAVNEVENLRVLSEEKTTIGGEEGVKSIWSYSVAATGDSAVTARVYVVKNDTIYKIEFLIDASFWESYSQTFEDIISTFKFI